MIFEEKLLSLHARRIEGQVADPSILSLLAYALEGSLPADYVRFLFDWRAPLRFFDTFVIIDSPVLGPGKRDSFFVERLLGATTGSDGLREALLRWLEVGALGYVPIGESAGGNLFCMSSQGAGLHVAHWHHDAPEDRAFTRVSRSFSEFILALRKVDDERSAEPEDADDGVVSIKLDF